MKIGDEVYVHGYIDEIRSDVVIIRNEGGYFGTVPSEVSSSEKPNNCEVKNYCDDCLYNDVCDSKAFFYACTSKATREPKTEPLDKDTNVRSKEDCLTCRYNWDDWDSEHCDDCSKAHSNYEPFVMYYPQVDGITPYVIIEGE